MKIKPGFKIRKVGKEYIVSAEGKNQINFNKIIALNDSAKFLWDNMERGSFNIESLTNILAKEYEISLDNARKDVEELISELIKVDIVE